MRVSPRRLGDLVAAVLGPDVATVRQGFVAVLLASGVNLLAGLTLGAITGTLEELPGLLVLVPAAIAMRGNVFGALGSRLGTAIHAGTFQISARRDTVVGQNILAALALSLVMSLALAVLAKGVAVAFGLEGTITVVELVVISVVGGAIASALVLFITLGIAAAAARWGWDLDTVAAPLVTSAGDVLTLPALVFATLLVDIRYVTSALAAVVAAAALVALVGVLRTGLPLLRRVTRESLPVLVLAGTVSLVAGVTIEKRLDSFQSFPALLVLVPPFLVHAGALGGILSSRLSSKLHLGVITPVAFPGRAARRDFVLIVTFALPLFVLIPVAAHLVGSAVGLDSPGVPEMVAVTLVAGLVVTPSVMAIAYYGAIGAFRLGLDPDNHGIPLVTSTMDFLGASALVLGIVTVGIGG